MAPVCSCEERKERDEVRGEPERGAAGREKRVERQGARWWSPASACSGEVMWQRRRGSSGAALIRERCCEEEALLWIERGFGCVGRLGGLGWG